MFAFYGKVKISRNLQFFSQLFKNGQERSCPKKNLAHFFFLHFFVEFLFAQYANKLYLFL